jgi:hypothetical protein
MSSFEKRHWAAARHMRRKKATLGGSPFLFDCTAASIPSESGVNSDVYFGSLKIAIVSPYAKPIWKLPPAATAMYCTPSTSIDQLSACRGIVDREILPLG